MRRLRDHSMSCGAMLEGLARANRVLKVTIAGEQRWAVVEDASRLRDALGVPLPIGVPTAFLDPVADPVGDLVSRYSRTHGPFTAADAAARLGLGVAIVTRRPASPGRRPARGRGRVPPGRDRIRVGRLRDPAAPARPLASPRCARMSSRSPQQRARPLPPGLAARRRHSAAPDGGGLRGLDGLVSAIDQLAGVTAPASAWESLILPGAGARLHARHARRADHHGRGGLDRPRRAERIATAGSRLHLADSLGVTLAEPLPLERSPLHDRILHVLDSAAVRSSSGSSARPSARTAINDIAVANALWDLVWAGYVANDTLAPLRARLGVTTTRPRATPRGRAYRARAAGAAVAALAATAPPTVAGRWSSCWRRPSRPPPARPPLAEQLLERYGVVTRGAVVARRARGRIRARLQRAELARRDRTHPPRLLHRRSRRRPVRHPRDRRSPARLRARSGGPHRRRARSPSPPPIRPIPTARRCPGRRTRMPTSRADTAPVARRAPWSCWSTAPSASTSSAAARPC